MTPRVRMLALVGVPLLTLALYVLLSVLFGAERALWAAGTFLAFLDRVFGILVFLPRWASWAVFAFVLAAGARFLLWENQKVTEGQRVGVIVAGVAVLLLAALVPPVLNSTVSSDRGVWWRPDTYRAPGTERRFDGILFAWVPAGRYKTGSSLAEAGRTEDERQREVIISRGFWVSRNEITVAEYTKVVGHAPEKSPVSFNKEDFPVTGISFDEADAFAERLTKNGGGTYRLPTENEWEYACRAGTTTRWSFGDSAAELPDYAWFAENSEKRPHSVGSLKPNPWNLNDLHGNAAEWCIAPTESDATPVQVFRGGDWTSNKAQCRSAARGIFIPGQTHMPETAGIRLVRNP